GAIKSPNDLAPDDWRRQNPRFQGENFAKNLELVRAIEAMAAARGCSASQLALAWVLSRGEHVMAIPGTRSIGRLEENAAAADMQFSEAELSELDAIAPPEAVAGTRY